MIIKIKSKQELIKIGYYDKKSIWLNEEERERRQALKMGDHSFFSVIDDYEEIYGKLISNDSLINSKYINFNDDDLIKIYGWAGEIITKETYPEYFL